MRTRLIMALGALATVACGQQQQASNSKRPEIKVRSAEQNQLHDLDAMNLSIALKRAIYDAGFPCKRVTEAGYVGEYKNLEMWMARCSEGRDWAVFAGPDGSAQVRDCRDVPGSGLPVCEIKKKPKGALGDANTNTAADQ